MSTNRAYPSGLADILDGTIDLVSDTLSLVLVVDGFVYDSADVDLADIAGGDRVGSLTSVAGTRSFSGATLITTASTVFSSVTAGDDVGGVLLVGPGASDADRVLIHLWRNASDRTPIFYATDDGDVIVEFPSDVILELRG